MAVRFGSGALQFELVEGWEKLPAGWTHPDVAAVCTSDEHVFVYCRGDHPVMIYDREGNFVDSWGDGMFTYRTHGMFMGDGNELYLVDDSGNSVGQYSHDGKLVQQIGPKGGDGTDTGYDGSTVDSIVRSAGPFNHPTNLAVAPSGELYVSDGYGNARVHRFSADGELLQSWGDPGSRPGQFHVPHSVWVHTDGRVFISDRQNDRIQIFGPSGEYLGEWTDVRRPQFIFIKDDLAYVGELMYHKGETSHRRGPIDEEEPSRLSVLDLDGNCLLRWSDPDPTKPGYFVAPHGLWVDDEGSIYMAEVTYTIGVRTGWVPDGTHTFQKFARV